VGTSTKFRVSVKYIQVKWRCHHIFHFKLSSLFISHFLIGCQ
jgi:hypothetical protein